MHFQGGNLSQVTQSMVSKWHKERDVIRAKIEKNPIQADRARKLGMNVKAPQLEEAISVWVNVTQGKVVITQAILRAKASQLGQMLKMPENEIPQSNGWLEGLQKRLQLSQVVRHGEASSVSMVDVTEA